MKFLQNPDNWQNEGPGQFAAAADGFCISQTAPGFSRWKCTLPCPRDAEALAFSVRFRTEECTEPLACYALITQWSDTGEMLSRMYGENSGNVKQCVFTPAPQCVRITVELGLKAAGRAFFGIPQIVPCPAPASRPVKIAATYLTPSPDPQTALERILRMIDETAREHPDLLILSETAATFGCGLPTKQAAEDVNGPFCRCVREKAKEHGMFIAAGFLEKDGASCYNTTLLFDRSGDVVGKYRKTHLTFAEYEAGILPGDELPVFDTELGRIGLLVCFDAYFPEPARILAGKGAELLVVSTIGDASFRHVSRALENGVYVAVAGTHSRNLNGCGIAPSKIISPTGNVLAQTDVSGTAAIARIDLADRGNEPWLSFPCEGAIPGNVYASECRPVLYETESKR